MTEPNEAATGYGFATNHIRYYEKGLTKREYFAAMAMQGLSAFNGTIDGKFNITPNDIASKSVIYADALIEALNKDK
jgi:hypothetical protein